MSFCSINDGKGETYQGEREYNADQEEEEDHECAAEEPAKTAQSRALRPEVALVLFPPPPHIARSPNTTDFT